SLEQAKLGNLPSAEKRLARHIVVVTGGAGAIGSATAKAFAAEGCEVAVLDLDEGALGTINASGGRILALRCNVAVADEVDAAFDQIVRRFGGIDIVVSNAGAAFTGPMAEL